ncbi:MAG: WD40 repeat domain-containing protein, partial [Xenococcaceae cyanobacterium]
LNTLKGHSNSVKAVAITPDNQKIVSGSSDGTVKIWDIDSGEMLHSFDGCASVASVAVTPDGSNIVTGCDDLTITMWQIPDAIA